ncbi:MAG: LysR family transcriptional regulator [Candidatus Symbiobacter sp.]|nr:LysR family transcriptional regulator [Candidatus Symbiobacter sp.]
MKITLRQMRYFVRAADSGQVSKAAHDLNVSQSAVTAAIQGLESDLRVKLFDRTPNGLRITAEGALFLARARTALISVDEAIHAPLTLGRNLTGTLRIGVTYTVAGYFFSLFHAQFLQQSPNLDLVVEESPRDLIEKRLIAGDLDVAVVLVSNLQHQDVLAYQKLLQSPRHLWLAANHRLRAYDKITLHDLVDEPFIMLEVDEARHTALRYWDAHQVKPNIIFSTHSVEAVRGLVANGVGVTILSDMVYRPYSLDGQHIEKRELVTAIPTMDIGLVWAKQHGLSPAAQNFCLFMRRAFNVN